MVIKRERIKVYFRESFEIGSLHFTLFKDLYYDVIEFLHEEVFANLKRLRNL